MVSSQKCPFCNPIADEIVAQNDLCYARWDRFPVSRGHLLVIPFRHEPDFFSLFIEEKQAMVALIDVCKGIVGEQFQPCRLQHRSQRGRGSRADHYALPLPRDPPVCRRCPGPPRRGAVGCAKKEGK